VALASTLPPQGYSKLCITSQSFRYWSHISK
jgi:hypothetical protein